jgi:hypothetical protein
VSTSPIISSLSYSNPAVNYEPVQPSSQQQPAQLPETTAQVTGDVVDLSQLAQMAQQGQSASVIAATTGLTVSQVDSDLGISTTSSSVAVAAPSGHGGEHPAAAAPVSAAAAPAARSDSKTATPAPTFSVRA